MYVVLQSAWKYGRMFLGNVMEEYLNEMSMKAIHKKQTLLHGSRSVPLQ